MNTRASLTIGVPAFLLLLGGCIIVDGTTNPTGGLGGNGGSTSMSSSSSSGDGGAGVGGMGGSAGAGVGGSGGGSSCAGPEDGMLTDLTCDTLNTKQTGSVCGPNNDLPPLANGTCTQGAKIFQGGAFDVLAGCLKKIEGDVTNACDDNQVKACVAEMYKAACPSQNAATACESIAANLCVNGETFDTQGCLLDTNPLNNTALQSVADCITNSAQPDCNDAYKDCFAQVISF
jgi:hypothetical protein